MSSPLAPRRRARTATSLIAALALLALSGAALVDPSPSAARSGHRLARPIASTSHPASWQSLPVVPRIDASLRHRLQTVFHAGLARGNRADVFVKVGDSITESGSFLQDIGCGGERLGTHADLAATVDYFRRQTFPSSFTSVYCGVANSFSRASATAVSGWSASDALAPLGQPVDGCPAPSDRPLACELRLLRPSVALIMYGTNDLDGSGVARFGARLDQIVRATLAAGTIPVLSTIPPRHDAARLASRVTTFNATIAQVAQREQVPLWNYWRALTQPGVLGQGISNDGVHPSIYLSDQGADLTAEGLRYGYNQRNLTALQTLDALRRSILESP